MNRRDFLAGAATGAAVAGGATYAATTRRPAPIEAGTPASPGAGTAAQFLADCIGATAVNMPGGEIMPAPQSGVIDMHEVSEQVNAETASEGDINRRIYESWDAFRRRAMNYQPLSDYGFIRNRARAHSA
jgi:hypothetical protein